MRPQFELACARFNLAAMHSRMAIVAKNNGLCALLCYVFFVYVLCMRRVYALCARFVTVAMHSRMAMIAAKDQGTVRCVCVMCALLVCAACVR
jgi:hypothetical protein